MAAKQMAALSGQLASQLVVVARGAAMGFFGDISKVRILLRALLVHPTLLDKANRVII